MGRFSPLLGSFNSTFVDLNELMLLLNVNCINARKNCSC